MTSRSYAISEKLKQAARQARGEPASGSSPSAKTLTHLNDEDPAKAHQRAKTKDLKTDTKLKNVCSVVYRHSDRPAISYEWDFCPYWSKTAPF